MNPIYLETRFKYERVIDYLPDTFAIVTAYATTGEHWPAGQNIAADERLRVYLESKFSVVQRITGYAPSTGHAEPGWLVNCSFVEGCDIGQRFKQDAIYWGECGQLFVSYCGEYRSKVRVSDFTRFDAS
jgi:hypothetical protein